MEIIFQTFGKTPSEGRVEIQTIMDDCYRRLGPHGLEIVDVLIFQDSSRMEAYSSREQESIGVYSAGLEADFVAMHEAWTGIPRILICYERLLQLSPLLREAILRHEVAHSVLHGSPEYYIFAIPRLLLESAKKYRLPRVFVLGMLYLISIGVKDYEATRFLLSRRYVEDQIAYSLHVSKTGKGDLESWRLSRGDPRKELLCLVGRFKDLAVLAATSCQQEWKRVDESPAKRELDYLPRQMNERLLEVTLALNEMNSHDTLVKVESITDLVVTRLMEPVFAGQFK